MSAKDPWVLLVDDHEDSRELLAEFLTMGGFVIEGCASGEEALDRVKAKGTPRAVVTDLTLGRMTGEELAEKLKGETPEVPIFAVTGHAGFADPKKLFTAVLTKPVALDKLTDALRRALSL